MKKIVLPLVSMMVFLSLPMLAHSSEEQILGLLTLPQVFGNGPCDRFSPETIPLFATPKEGVPMASIRVTANWKFPREGGCTGLEVRCHFAKNIRSGGELPTEEFDDETPAAIVVEKAEDWFRIRLSDGTGWLRASPGNRFIPLEELLTSHIPYLTADWDGWLYEEPMGKIKKAAAKPHMSAKILSIRRINRQLWFKIKIPVENECGEMDVTVNEAVGWIPAYAKNNRPTLWFSSRGC